MLPALLRRKLSRRTVIAGVVALMALTASVTWQLFHAKDIDLDVMTATARRPLVVANGKVEQMPAGDYLDPTTLVDTTGCSATNVIKWNGTQFTCAASGGGGITNSATVGVIPISDGTNIIGPTLSTQMLLNGALTQTLTVPPGVVAGTNGEINLTTLSGTGHLTTTGDIFAYVVRNGVTFDTTAGANASGVFFAQTTSSRSAGANPLTNTAYEANVQNGDTNYAFHDLHGDIQMDTATDSAVLGVTTVHGLTCSGTNPVDLSSASAVTLGANVQTPVVIPASAGSTAELKLGITGAGTSGMSVHTKNTNAAQTFTGMEILGDTTVLATVRPSLLLFRGAGGGTAGSIEGGLVIASGAGFPFAQSTANSYALFAEGGQPLMFGADSGFNASMAIQGDATGDVILMPGSPGIAGHLRTQGAAVGLTNATCSSSTCNDIAGTVTSSSTSMTITFNKTYTGADDAGCILQAMGNTTVPTFTTSATALTATVVVNATKYHYICLGH
ncbi:MAG TPA: hypothetical protein VIV09_03040 [Pseudolabrys sp.]